MSYSGGQDGVPPRPAEEFAAAPPRIPRAALDGVRTRRIIAVCLDFILVYPVHATTRKSLGDMTRKLSVTESRRSAQRRGTFSRRKSSVASANWAHVA